MCGLDVDKDGFTDVLLVAAPMFLGAGNKEAGRVYIYNRNRVRERETLGLGRRRGLGTVTVISYERGATASTHLYFLLIH